MQISISNLKKPQQVRGNFMLLLTSAGFLNPKVADKVMELINDPTTKKVAIVTTAAEGKETNVYSKLAKDQLEKMGFSSVDFLDLETQKASSVTNYDIIYVCGGNTFKLLKFARETDFKNTILKVLDKGGLYIGVSAGSLLVGPSVKIAGEVAADENDVGITDFIGLNLVNVVIFPHYKPKHETEIKNFEEKNNTTVTRLTNNQALMIKGQEINIIE